MSLTFELHKHPGNAAVRCPAWPNMFAPRSFPRRTPRYFAGILNPRLCASISRSGLGDWRCWTVWFGIFTRFYKLSKDIRGYIYDDTWWHTTMQGKPHDVPIQTSGRMIYACTFFIYLDSIHSYEGNDVPCNSQQMRAVGGGVWEPCRALHALCAYIIVHPFHWFPLPICM